MVVSQGLRVEIGFDDERAKEDPNLHCQLVYVLHFVAHWYHDDYRLLQLYVVTKCSNAGAFPSYHDTQCYQFARTGLANTVHEQFICCS